MMSTALPIIEESKTLTVSTVSARQKAADLWDAIRAFQKQAEAQKEETCRPLKTAWDNAKKPFDDFVKECQEHNEALLKKMSEWDREQDRLAKIEQAKIQAKIDAENAKKIAKAEEKGKDVSEVVLKVAPVIQAPAKSIETQAGTTQQRVEKMVYGIKGLVTNSPVKADDPIVAPLLAKFPTLFELNWVAFRKLASTGMLDVVPNITKSIEYEYRQRGK